MSLTRRQVHEFREERFRHVRLARRSPAPSFGHWLTERGVLPGRWPIALAGAWLVIYVAAAFLEPAPPASEAEAMPVWAGVMFIALTATLAAMCAGLARGQRYGLVASVVAAGIALTGAVACPVSGHHPAVGAWWFAQMAGFTGLIGLSLAALRRTRAGAGTGTGGSSPA